MNNSVLRYLNSQYGKVQEKIKLSVLSGKPIIYLHTQEMEILNYLLENKSIYKDCGMLSGQNNVKNSGVVRYDMTLINSADGISWASKNPLVFIQFYPEGENSALKSTLEQNLVNFIGLYTGSCMSHDIRKKSGGVPVSVKKSVVIVMTPVIPDIPKSIEIYSEYVLMDSMENDELKGFITAEIKKYDKNAVVVQSSGYEFWEEKEYLNALAQRFKGLTKTKITQIFCKINQLIGTEYVVDRKLNPEITDIIRKEKEQMIATSGVLTLEKVPKNFTEVSGLESLAEYLKERKPFIDKLDVNRKGFGTGSPKGVLVSGIPGSGKSMMAKYTAGTLGLTLIRMNMGDVQDKYVGASERRMTEALSLVEAMSPCVLWIDEIEKNFSGSKGSSGDNGVTKRMFGKFLTWMQEIDKKHVCCFVFATANDISSLPPELFRSGRFDAKFSTFMPTSEECGKIFSSIIKKHNGEHKELIEESGDSDDRNLFDETSINAALFERYLNSSLCLRDKRIFQSRESVNPAFPMVSRENKFFIASDIENVIKRAKELYCLNYECYISKEKGKYVYNTEFFKACIEEAIMEIRTYGETDLLNIASCFAALAYNNFRPASGTVIMPFRCYDEARKEQKDNRECHVLYRYEPETVQEETYGLAGYKNRGMAHIRRSSEAIDEADFIRNMPSNYDRCLFCMVRNQLNQSADSIIQKRKGEAR